MILKFAILSLLLSFSLGSDAQLNHHLKGPKRKNNPFVVKPMVKKDSLEVGPAEFEFQKSPRRKNYFRPNRRKTSVNVVSGGIDHNLQGPKRKNND
jgi:hypothetical protein